MRFRPGTTATASIGLSMVLFVGACGSDGPSHSEFAAQVKKICGASGQRHEKVTPAFDFASFNPDTSDLTTIVPTIEGHVAISRETAAELAKVDGPEADIEARDQFVALAKEIHDVADDEIAAAEAGDRDAFKSATEQDDSLQSQAAKVKGFEGC